MNISSPFQDNDLFAFLERESLPLIKSGQNNFVEKTVQALVQVNKRSFFNNYLIIFF